MQGLTCRVNEPGEKIGDQAGDQTGEKPGENTGKISEKNTEEKAGSSFVEGRYTNHP